MSLVGQVLGKYRVVEQVGRGGMGTVYRAVDETLHRDVALKTLNAELNDPGVGRRFRAEAVAIARLNHPGIATIFELFQHDGQWLMAIEFVRGQTLEDLVTHGGPVTTERAVELVSQALAALGHAHGMGVVHRDLKPANLMLAESGRLKVMDFGIARVAGTEHLTSAGFLVGTPAYMAPEQLLGQEIDARTDLYSMGCVLYFLVTGKLPFPGTTPLELAESRIKSAPTPVRAVRSDLPVWLEQVLDRALARDPAERHQSADAFRDALRRGVGVSTSTTNPAMPVTNPAIAMPAMSETVRPGSLPVSSQLGFPPPAPPPTDEFGTAETRLLRAAPGAAPATATASPTPPPAAGACQRCLLRPCTSGSGRRRSGRRSAPRCSSSRLPACGGIDRARRRPSRRYPLSTHHRRCRPSCRQRRRPSSRRWRRRPCRRSPIRPDPAAPNLGRRAPPASGTSAPG